MKKLVYIFTLIFSFSLIAQNKTVNTDFRVDLLTIEKNTKDTLAESFTEIYSGRKRIKVSCCPDFNGIDVLHLNQKDIVDNTIFVKFMEESANLI